MLLPDLMHEFELGVWRAIFIHLMRILQSLNEDLLIELDRRYVRCIKTHYAHDIRSDCLLDSYREIPSFGRDTIRRFSANSSEMKKMAAHNFENLLQVCTHNYDMANCTSDVPIQCSIAVFEGLLPEPHNRAVMKLLFTMAHWHALAKLRMHNDLSLDLMDAVTVSLGKALRTFRDTTCSVFHTKELRREYNARIRREAKKSASKSHVAAPDETLATSSSSASAVHTNINPDSTLGATATLVLDGELSNPPVVSQVRTKSTGAGRRDKTLNLSTFKCHSLGDYARTIRKHGTTDSYSTEPVSKNYFFINLKLTSTLVRVN
jgi:hypothetical protein